MVLLEYLWPMIAIPVSLRFFYLLNSMIYDLKRSVYLRWLFNPVQYSSLDDLVLMLKCYLLIYWAPFEFPFFWYVWYSFVNTASTKTYVVLVAKQMLKHLRIAKNCPFQVSWQVKFKCRYVCLVSLSVRFLSIVITRLCWYPKLPLLYYFVFPIVTQKICCLETIPSCVNSTSLSFKLFLKFTKMG